MPAEETQRFKSMTSAASMATRLPTAVILISLVSVVIATIVGVRTGSSLGRDLTDDQLVAQRASGASDVAAQVASLGRTATALASSPQAIVAIDSFASAHEELSETDPEGLTTEIEGVITTDRENYLEPLAAAGRDLDLREIVADNTAAVYLQYHYAVDLGVVENASVVDDAGDGSRWSEVHDVVHPVYRDVADRLNLRDLYLVEADRGVVVYSVSKRPDLGTSLDVGPFSGSFLAALVDAVRANPAGGTVLSDISFYDPALLTPVAATAAPVMDGPRLVGVLVLMYDASQLTEILTAGGDGDQAGPSPGAQSYLVGSDGLIRSDPRAYLQDPGAYLAASVGAGEMNEAQRSFIDAAGTTVLTQPVVDETADAGLDGDQSVRLRRTMVGDEAFSTVEAVALDGVDWFVATEIDVDAAERDLGDFVDLLVAGTAIFIVGLVFLAIAWAARIVQPVRAISERLRSNREALGPIDVPPRSPIEFQRLAKSFESMSEALADQQAQLAKAREDRLRLLRRMLPPAIAERVARGDMESLEEVPQATIVVIVVLGLGALVRDDASAGNRELVDSIHAELDELANRNGVERLKVVGDAYFASCGHGQPYIDHAPRAVSFALDARHAVRELGAGTAGGLDVSVGLHTGPVTMEVSAENRLLYDVWGWPVTAAHNLARRGQRGDVLVSNTTKVLLPDTVEAIRWSGLDDDAVWKITSVPVSGPA